MMLERVLRIIFHNMEKHYVTFRIIVWMREHGITRKIAYFFTYSRDKKLRRNPSDEMLENQKYFSDYKDRINRMLPLLADEKSRQVWRNVARYKTYREPIKPGLYSEEDQYFVKDIIYPEPGEVFIDGGGIRWRHSSTIPRFM